jgi:stearoyl-CoA desaturase (delta-9 desaturase)
MKSSTRGAQIFVIFSLLLSIAGIYTYGITVENLLLVIAGYFAYGCLGIVVTFHRHLTHNSYKTYPLLTKIFSVLGCLAGTGSPLAWVAIHINHHLKSDKPSDPHSPLYKGIKIFALNYEHEVDPSTKWKMRKLVTDPFHQFIHRYYFGIIIAWSLLLYSVGGFYLMVFLHLAPAFVTAIMSNMVNYVGHKPTWWGAFRTYNLNDQSTNNWVWAIPSWGESWHNNHHRFPRNFSTGQGLQLDISGLVIKLLKIK